MSVPLLILASQSPRRRQLLAEAGYTFRVVPPDDDVECGVCTERGPAGLVSESAYRKASAVRELLGRVARPESATGVAGKVGRTATRFAEPQGVSPGAIVVAADTVAECDGQILGKPRDEADARAMLRRLSGRLHRVLTGVCVWPVSLPLPVGEGRGEGALSSGAAHPLLPADLLKSARDLRLRQTDAESLMWALLRNRRLGGFEFRRQLPLEPYILDFYCSEQRLAIELDGCQHNTELARRKDEGRTRFLSKQGIQVLRFWNHDVLQDTDAVLEAIWNALHASQDAVIRNPSSQDTLTPNPSPTGRGGPDLPLPVGEGRDEGAPLLRVAVTELRMDPLTDRQLDEYLAGGQWEGKAGAFGYQDGLDWVHVVEGSESNVVGLPLELLAEMLAEVQPRGEA